MRLLLLPFLAVAALPALAHQLTVEITGIEPVAGQLMVGVYDSAAAFDDDGEPVAARRAPVEGSAVTLVFEGLATGEHAVKLYHDANGNGELDSNMLGLPTEGYGFSGSGGGMGPPVFEEARFRLEADRRIAIELR